MSGRSASGDFAQDLGRGRSGSEILDRPVQLERLDLLELEIHQCPQVELGFAVCSLGIDQAKLCGAEPDP